MRLTKRKAAILERARAQAEALFWKFLEDNETEGEEIANEPHAKVRRGRPQEMKKRLARIAITQLPLRLIAFQSEKPICPTNAPVKKLEGGAVSSQIYPTPHTTFGQGWRWLATDTSGSMEAIYASESAAFRINTDFDGGARSR